MPYYSEEIIEEVRQRSPIVDVIGSYVHLTKKGGNYFGLCPFHNEKSPSFSVSPSRQMFHCFGCGAGGNVITFIMDHENYSFPEALQFLADRAGVALPKQEFTPEMKREQDERSLLFELHKEAAYFYVALLKSEQGKIGLDYLHKRGLTDDTIRSFGLGYSSAHPAALYHYLQKKGYTDRQLKDSGLVTIKERGASDRFWNRVMFPIMDINNRVIGFGGRVMGDGEPKYLNSPEMKIFDKSRNLYGMNVARRTKERFLLVCEGYMDVISMHQAGFTNTVASLGTAFTNQHGMLLKRYTDEVILCYDSDGPGRKAALRAIPILKEAGLKIRVLNMEPYKDPDEFIKNLGADAFRERISQAMNSFLYEVAVAKDGYDFSDPEDKANFFNETAKKLASFSDEIERNSYTEAVAKKYGIDYNVLKSKVSLLGNQIGLTKPAEEAFKPKSAMKPQREKNAGIREAQKLVLTELSSDASLYGKVASVLNPGDFTDPFMKEIAEALYDQLSKGPSYLNPAAILTKFVEDERYQEAASVLSSSFVQEESDEESEDRFEVLNGAVMKILNESLDRQISETTDPMKLMDLLKEKQDLKGKKQVLG